MILSIRVEMVDARDNRQLWGEQYNRRRRRIALSIQQEIAQTVASNLRLKLDARARTSGKLDKRTYTENAEAYQNLLKGRYYSVKSTGETDLQKSRRTFSTALSSSTRTMRWLMPGWQTHYWYRQRPSVCRRRDVMPKAKAAALKALEIRRKR
ncbi:MAG: hypothetical protein WKF71_11415 [Pyrinomonadaceae bacterium]